MCVVWVSIVMLKHRTSRENICWSRRRNTWNVTGPTVMKKWKWLFVNPFTSKGPVSTATVFLGRYNVGYMHVCSAMG